MLPSSLDSFQAPARVDFDHYFSIYSWPGCSLSLSLLLFKFTLTVYKSQVLFSSIKVSHQAVPLFWWGLLPSQLSTFLSPTAQLASSIPSYFNLSFDLSSQHPWIIPYTNCQASTNLLGPICIHPPACCRMPCVHSHQTQLSLSKVS